MRVISPKMLRLFWAVHPRAESPLRVWLAVVRAAEWATFADLRAVYPAADLVGTCTVFNVGGNKYRLIARVFFPAGRVYTLAVLTHAEYDARDWAADCGCHLPPPAPPRPAGDADASDYAPPGRPGPPLLRAGPPVPAGADRRRRAPG